MSLPTGARLGPYEIVSLLGSGGMGEVYGARDTRLDRRVAVKILPPELALSAPGKARFDREAKTISQLNHPHICALYDVGEQDGRPYLVMELVEGESLARRLLRGRLPSDEVVRIGMDIAEALEVAHRAGIVHRDLKPANIMLTASGAKLLDFGIAKPLYGDADDSSVDSETAARPLTDQGAIVGTLQYMAPEQFEGRADERTDIFAFGTVLYEMATGTAAFDGTTRASVMAAVLAGRPPSLSTASPASPPLLERVIETCLQKSPRDRWQCVSDVRLVLSSVLAAEDRQSSPLVVPRSRNVLPWILTALLFVVATGSLFVAWRSGSRPAGAVIRSVVLPPEDATFDFSNATAAPPEISPDGRKIVFGASSNGRSALYVRDLGEGTPRLLRGTDAGRYPFWSPDSRWIGFFADSKLKRIGWDGGSVEVLADARDARGGAWGTGGTILFGQRNGPIQRWSPQTQRVEPAAVLTPGLRSQRWPRFLPDGRHFLFLDTLGGEENVRNAIAMTSLDRVRVGTPLVKASAQPLFHDGHLLFVRDQVLHAQRLDVDGERLEGEAFPVREPNIAYEPLFSRAVVSVADDGTLLYQTGSLATDSQLTWFDRKGNAVGTFGPPDRYALVDISPDGAAIAYTLRSPRAQRGVWIGDLKTGGRTRVTFQGADNWPIWSRDNRSIVFASARGERWNLAAWDRESGAERTLFSSPATAWPGSVSSDGRIVFHSERGEKGIDLHYLSLDDSKDHVYVATENDESIARVSPDGKLVAFQSFEDGSWRIYIAPFPFTGPKWLVPIADATMPLWRADGRELFFATSTQLYAVSVSAAKSLTLGEPAPLFTLRPGTPPPYGFDVTEDGQRFLINARPGEEPPPAPLTLVQNFRAELRRAGQTKR
jgi:serine/threonine protein kinase